MQASVLTYFLYFILFINVILAIIIVFFERRNPTAALAWVVILLFFSIAGFFLYLVFGQNFYKKRLFRLKEQDDRHLHALVSEQKKELLSAKETFADPRFARYREMIYMLLNSNQAYLTRDNRVEIYTDGNDKFRALLEAIEGAQDHIHMEYYILRTDEMGGKVIDSLTRKAREGVEVRWLYDALGCSKVPKSFYQGLLAAGGKIAPFFPSHIPLINLRFNYRNHRKIVVIDGKTGFIGGFNIGDEYLGKGPLGYWRDSHLKIQGTAVSALQVRFILDWNFAAKDDVKLSSRFFPDHEGPGDTAIQLVSGGPDVRWSPIKESYLKLITTAEESIYLQSPYFVPDDSVLDALRIAALSGVDVRIMIPSKPDHPFVYWSSYSFIGDLLDAGVRAYTYDNGFIHAKTVVVDGFAGSVGSANWDVRSFKLNFEANAIMYDLNMAGKLRDIFLQDLEVSTEITPERYAARSNRIKVKESISRLMAPIL
jgi:cardiolipin synthase